MEAAEESFHPRNSLNALSGKKWIRFTRSWFVHNPPPRRKTQITHPAKFPEPMVREFIEYFTKPGQVVLDPFSGVGSTALAALQCGRRAIGVELNPRYLELAREHAGPDARLILGDASDVPELVHEPVDFIMTSPPYWDMLAHSRGGVFSTHKARKARGLDTVYSTDARDLGCISDYSIFVQRLSDILKGVASVLKPGGYMVIVVQNLRSPEGRMVRLAWDLAAALDSPQLVFKGERIWCQDNKLLGIWGYPSEYVSNVHHHYCLIFRSIQPGRPSTA